MAILYKANETQFNHLGLGPLNDAISILVTEERNGIFELEMKYPVSGKVFHELKNDRIIKADAGHKLKDQRFKIIRISKPLKGIVTVYAEHVSYLTQDLALKPKVSFNGNARQALEHWKANLVDDNPFTVWSDISTTGKINWTIDEVENARRALGGVQGSILDVYGGEYLFDNYDIYLYQKRGVNSELLIAYGRNLVDLEQEEEIANTYTSIYPYSIYTDDDGNERMVTLPEYYIDSEHVDKYARRKILVVDFTTDEIETVSALRSAAKRYIKDNDVGVPSVNLKIQYVDLAKTLDYKHLALYEEVNLCDNVMIYFEKYDINTTAKVIKVVWDVLNERYDSIEVGEARASLSQAIDTVVDGKVHSVEKLAMQTLRTADGKNTIYFGLEEPLATQYPLKKNDIWYRIVDGEFTRTYRYDGVTWQLIIDMDSAEAKEEARQAQERADDAVNRANQATGDAQNAIEQAQTSFNKAQENATQIDSLGLQIGNVEDGLTTISGTVDGLQTTVTDVQGNVSNLTQLSNTLQTRLSDAEGNINELTLTSQSMQSTISSLQDEWDNLEIGGRNLLPNTDFKGDIGDKSPAGWSYNNHGTVYDKGELVVSPFDSNKLAMHIKVNNARYYIQQDYFVPVNAGEKITISVNATSKDLRIWWEFTENPNRTTYVERNTNFKFTKSVGNRLYETFTVPEGANYFYLFRIGIGVTGTSSGEVVFDGIKLEKGNKATDWSPAPEDMATQSQITQLSDAINLRVAKGDVINQINISDESILIDGKRIHITGQTTIDDAAIKSAHIESLDAGKITTGVLDAGKISVINLSANSIVGGILQSQNSNTVFNLNTGALTMQNTDFTLGGGVDIEFTSAENRMYYKRYDPVGNITRSAGIGVGTSINDRFPYVFMGTTNTLRPNPRDQENFTGFIANTRQRQLTDGIGNSSVGYVFDIRDEAVSFTRGFRFNLNRNRIAFHPLFSGNHSYDIGTKNNTFNRIYVNDLRTEASYFAIRNKFESTQGLRVETGYGGKDQMVVRKIHANDHMDLGSSTHRFSYIYLRYQPDVSSDVRLKENIQPNELGLDFINDLETKTFQLINNNPKMSKEPIQYGIIAQQLKSTLIKHGVNTDNLNLLSQSEDGMYGVQYSQLIAPTIKAIQELDTKFTDDVNYLKLKVQYLEQKIKQLEGVA